MGIDCSCLRLDQLEEKTIITGTASHNRAQSNAHQLQPEIIEKDELSGETLECSDCRSQCQLSLLSRKYLAKNLLKSPSNFFEALPEPLDFYVPEVIKQIEAYLYSIPLHPPPKVYRLSASEVYQGLFDDHLRKTGLGIQMVNDEKYIGVFVRGRREGYGRIIKTDSSVYEGDFSGGMPNGEGTCIEGEIRYKGLFKNGVKSSYGREDWPDKSVYFGEFSENFKHGNGKFVWGNGNEFEGQFQHGDISGTGVFKWKNGKAYCGQWKKNKMHGFGEFLWPDGKKYIGYYRKDVKHGDGTLIWPDGREYEGQWKHGLQHGVGYYKWYNKLKEKQEQRKGEWSKGNRVQWLN